jgi:hypothetical protein
MFTQIGLDSGSLTMLGSVIHSFGEPGEYRGSVHGEGEQVVFYVTVDKNSPVAQVNIDLATLARPTDPAKECCEEEGTRNRFSVNPKGYALFHVSQGPGGFYVHVRKAEENRGEKIFDSRSLGEGDIFSAVLLRPGTYSVANTLTDARAEVVISYPQVGKTPYRPPGPVRVQVTKGAFEPRSIRLSPAQALLFDCHTEARIRIELEKPDDGPGRPRRVTKREWKKNVLPGEKA